jgi:hydrogenase/urease accessory protein HupE
MPPPFTRPGGGSARPWWGAALVLVAVLGAVRTAAAHPAPWSYVDVRIDGATLDVTLTIHVYDLAHEFSVPDAEGLLSASALAAHADRAVALLRDRFAIELNGRRVDGVWRPPVPSGEGDSVRFEVRFTTDAPIARLALDAWLFPYDPLHQTFLNVYRAQTLEAQVILDADSHEYRHTTGLDPGVWAVVREFVPAGIHHILIGPDHVLFLVGLLLLGGTWRRLVVVVTAFTLAHSVTLSLAALGGVTPPASVIEPAIALSIVYVGLDALLVRGGRDARTWIAFVFGLIHGFGFANVLREMALPPSALVWSLASFNLGVEIGQLAIVVVVAAVFGAIRSRSERAGRQLTYAGSVVVIAAGAYWFVERVFLGGA